LDKPHLEQDQIRGLNYPKVSRLWGKFKVLGRGSRVGRLTLMVTSGLDGWSPLHMEHRTRLTDLLAQKFFPGYMRQRTGMRPKP
jgi:hypothetical protein